ncbi:TrmH family RNA methyltransferase, partial [Adlercreutzia equolifaciens]|uniref:TrmH family RNA methyltransferase n=1 Tax=Adlercreutzia equolifaciens TaxID=446660 RepID=UPI0023B0C5FD
PSLADTVGAGRLVAVREDITNHTNVGAIFRSAAAMGVDAVLASPACYDPLYRRAVRVSMGTVFQVPSTRIGNLDEPNRPVEGTWSADGLDQLKDLGFT